MAWRQFGFVRCNWKPLNNNIQEETESGLTTAPTKNTPLEVSSLIMSRNGWSATKFDIVDVRPQSLTVTLLLAAASVPYL